MKKTIRIIAKYVIIYKGWNRNSGISEYNSIALYCVISKNSYLLI